MKTLLKLDNDSPLNKQNIAYIKATPEKYPDILNNISELELSALQFYKALPRFRKKAYTAFTQKTNCNITWYPKERFLTFGRLLFADTAIFKVAGGKVNLIDGEMGKLSSVNSIKALMIEAVEFYLNTNKREFKNEILEAM